MKKSRFWLPPGSRSKLADKGKGDLEPPQLLLPAEQAGSNAGDPSEHLKTNQMT